MTEFVKCVVDTIILFGLIGVAVAILVGACALADKTTQTLLKHNVSSDAAQKLYHGAVTALGLVNVLFVLALFFPTFDLKTSFLGVLSIPAFLLLCAAVLVFDMLLYAIAEASGYILHAGPSDDKAQTVTDLSPKDI